MKQRSLHRDVSMKASLCIFTWSTDKRTNRPEWWTKNCLTWLMDTTAAIFRYKVYASYPMKCHGIFITLKFFWTSVTIRKEDRSMSKLVTSSMMSRTPAPQTKNTNKIKFRFSTLYSGITSRDICVLWTRLREWIFTSLLSITEADGSSMLLIRWSLNVKSRFFFLQSSNVKDTTISTGIHSIWATTSSL